MSRLTFVVLTCVWVSAFASPGIVTGPKTSSKDDARSDATCPDGEFVFDCACDVEGNCDGGQISTDGRTCSVFNRSGKKGVVAVADCRPAIKVVTSGDWAKNPRVDCEDGYAVQTCRRWSAWMQMGGYGSATAVKDGNGCQIKNCPKCRVYAVCLYKGV